VVAGAVVAEGVGVAVDAFVLDAVSFFEHALIRKRGKATATTAAVDWKKNFMNIFRLLHRIGAPLQELPEKTSKIP
jgi:hypothetical protein